MAHGKQTAQTANPAPLKPSIQTTPSKSDVCLRTRFAPTPSGFLHWGNAYSFVLTWLVARQNNGSVLLRIDDLDAHRKRPEFVEDVFRSLEWLGLDYDDGPMGPDDFESRFSQRHRLDLYRESLNELQQTEQLFACECSRASIQRDTSDGLHPANCQARQIPLDHENVAWRIATSSFNSVAWTDCDQSKRDVNLHATMRDFVVQRKDQIPAYQVASLVDDIHFGVTHIVRGFDLIESTAAQIALARLLNLSQFSAATFLHHPLLTDFDGSKLSKSSGAPSLKAMRESESTPAAFYERLSPLLGLEETVQSAADALVALRSS